MKHHKLTIVFGIFLVAFMGLFLKVHINSNTVKPNTVKEHIRNSIVSITFDEQWAGTGVVIHKVYKPFVKTYILTANHVIAAHESYDFKVHVIVSRNGVASEDIFLDMKVEVEGDDIKDLAIISVHGDIGKVSRGFMGETLVDEKVYACAGINGGINVVTEGYITGKEIAEWRDRHSADSSFGHSGSAVFNYRGEIIGILSQMVMDQVNYGMFGIPDPIRSRLLYVPMRYIKSWLEENDIRWIIKKAN